MAPEGGKRMRAKAKLSTLESKGCLKPDTSSFGHWRRFRGSRGSQFSQQENGSNEDQLNESKQARQAAER